MSPQPPSPAAQNVILLFNTFCFSMCNTFVCTAIVDIHNLLPCFTISVMFLMTGSVVLFISPVSNSAFCIHVFCVY